MSTKADFPNLTVSGLENMLRDVTALAGLALGRRPLESWFPDWSGVSQLLKDYNTGGYPPKGWVQ
jgi:hypothetical protein